MIDNKDSFGFIPNYRTAWQNVRLTLSNDVDSLILVAFRVLVCFLDQHGFFRHPAIIRGKSQAKLAPELMDLLKKKDPTHVGEFANLVHSHLDPQRLSEAAELAFTIDEQFGSKLSATLNEDDPWGWKDACRAVNTANKILMAESGARPMILVRPPQRYWSEREGVLPEFLLESQGTDTYFKYLLPTTTGLKHVHYSLMGRALEQRLIVALWPVQAPSITSRAITKRRAKNNRVPFYFKCWDDLPETHRKQQTSFAASIADYIQHNARDDLDIVHIVAAPELTLAPESLTAIINAIGTRRHAEWIVLPGSYHVEMQREIINRAPIFIGGKLREIGFAEGSPHADTVAIKCTPVVLPIDGHKFEEEINGDESFTHLLDTSIGRIAVMICRDFLNDDLRTDVVRMSIDHLFILSMSPDSGKKFKIAMDNTSNYRTACFFVNAFTKKSPHAGHRKPLKRKTVVWRRKGTGKTYRPIVLKP